MRRKLIRTHRNIEKKTPTNDKNNTNNTHIGIVLSKKEKNNV